MLGYIGLFAGLALLIWFALRGVNIFLASVICALVVAIPNGILLPSALLEHYPFGPLGAYTFAGKFFLLFLCGAIFGKAMATSSVICAASPPPGKVSGASAAPTGGMVSRSMTSS